MSDILDRKNILWESSRMFLPEHRQALLEQHRKVTEYHPPELDEDQKTYMNYLLQEALETEKPILATFATQYSPQQFCGFIDHVDLLTQTIHLSNGTYKQLISFQKLLNVEWP
ncbi:YolD-like family protein [Hazenella coriacea]|uniref:YolD-like protein n=1 Tax=Hazenella coriacea TaxID=1179467 RepID=A0A4R3LA36_9BACL|nr:YolD-like family protein [Hazenella coriacea]TCS95104.1 YolD-like protein [Hazenella coriacea]